MPVWCIKYFFIHQDQVLFINIGYKADFCFKNIQIKWNTEWQRPVATTGKIASFLPLLLLCPARSRRPSKLDVSKIIFPLIRLALNVLLCLQLRATGGATAAVRGTTRRGEAALQHESGEWLLNAAGKCVMWATLSKLLKPCFDVNFCNGLAWPSLSPPPPPACRGCCHHRPPSLPLAPFRTQFRVGLLRKNCTASTTTTSQPQFFFALSLLFREYLEF